MSEDWQAGDIALCVRDCNFRDPRCREAAKVSSIYYAIAPRRGQRFTVDRVEVRELGDNYEVRRAVYLGLREAPENHVYLARCFRKVAPDAELNEQERREQVPA